MGLDSLLQQNMQNAGLAGTDRLARNAMFPQSQMDKTQYAVSSQMPTGAEAIKADYDTPTNSYTGLPTQNFAAGGIASIPRYDGEDGSQVQAPENDLTLGNPDLNNLAYETLSNSERVSSLNALKEADPQQYKIELMNALGDSLKYQYNANENYEPTWKQFSELKEADPAQWNRNQLSWLGHQQGWQIGQNRSERNEAGLPVIQDQIEQAKKSGLGEDEINSILGSSSQAANIQNQNRIINEAQSGHGPMGMTTQDYLTVAAILGSGAAAAYFAPAAGATSGGYGITASQVPNLGAGLGATGGTLGGTGAGGFGLTGASTGGMGLTAGALGTGVPASLAVPTTGALAGGTEAGYGLKDAYKAYQNFNRAKNAVNMLSGSDGVGGTSAASGNQSINNPYAMSTGFNPGTVAGTGLSAPVDYRSYMQPKVELTDLSKMGDIGDIYSLAAGGGISTLGSYSDGGRLLKGPGDGMSDHIPAKIGNSQPARLADGEFVVPADVVSHLGNGSTDAGAKQLYSMMDKIRKARTGNKKQGKQINASKFLPQG